MPNEYYNYDDDFVPGAPVRSEKVDAQFIAITEAFDKLGGPADLNTGAGLGGEDTGSSDNYVVNNGGSSTLSNLQLITYIPAASNTGPAVISVNGGANVPIVRNDSSPLQEGDLIAGVPVMLIYDDANTRWVIIGATAQQTRGSLRPKITTQAGTTYTLVALDEGSVIQFTSGSAITVTIPSNATTSLPTGYIVHLHQIGAGQVSVTASGVTVTYPISAKTRARYSTLSLIKADTDTWRLFGDADTA